MTFELRENADVAEFLTTDTSVQTNVAYQCPGLARRTTGRNGERWLVLQVWASEEAARDGRRIFDESAEGSAFMALVDPTTVSIEHFSDLD